MRGKIAKTLTALIGAAALVTSVQAQAPVEKKGLIQGGWANTTVKNNYTGEDFGMAFGDNVVIQSDLGVNLPHGISADIWSNYDTGLDKDKRYNEFDGTVSFPVPVNKIGMKGVKSSMNLIYMTFPKADIKDVGIAQLKLSPEKVPVTLTLFKGWGVNSGNGYAAKIAYDGVKPLENKRSAITYGLSVMANSHLFTTDTDLAAVGGYVGLTHKLSDKVTLALKARKQFPIDKFNGTFSKRTTFGATVNRDF